MLHLSHLRNEPLLLPLLSTEGKFPLLSAVFLKCLVHVEGTWRLQPAPVCLLGSTSLSAPQQATSPFRGLGFVMLKLKEVRFVISPAMDHSIRRAMVPHSRAAQGLEIGECILASPSLAYLQCFHFHR